MAPLRPRSRTSEHPQQVNLLWQKSAATAEPRTNDAAAETHRLCLVLRACPEMADYARRAATARSSSYSLLVLRTRTKSPQLCCGRIRRTVKAAELANEKVSVIRR
jgi:hypothetical protein